MADSCSIDAVFHSEERYSKISFAYTNEEDREVIEKAIAEATKGCNLETNIYASDVTEGKSVIVIEFHDDYDREGGEIFNKILDKLDIKVCQ